MTSSSSSDKKDKRERSRSRDRSTKPKKNAAVRLAGVAVLLAELAFLFSYGFEGFILNEVSGLGGVGSGNVFNELLFTQYGSYFLITALFFAVVGFGCLFGALMETTISGFFTSFFIVAFTTLFSPLLQQFWYFTFTGGFEEVDQQAPVVGGDRDYLFYQSGSEVWLSVYVLRISALNAISQLVVFYSVFQKFNAGQVFLFSGFFQIGWTLNYALNVELMSSQPDSLQRFMDDYAISQVFLFGSVFGTVMSIIAKRPPRIDLHMGNNLISLILSTVGAFILFLSFMGIGLFFPIKDNRNRYFWSEGILNIIFALSASTFTTMFMSSILKKRLGLRELHFGIIGGAILAGPVAGTMDNFGAFMAIGTFAGIVNAIYFAKIDPKINGSSILDTYGGLYILIISFLGTMLVQPVVLIGMHNNDVQSNLLDNVLVDNYNSAGWSLIYVGLSVGIALFGGLITGIATKSFGRENGKEFEDRIIFDRRIGLKEAHNDDGVRSDPRDGGNSASHLRNDAGV
jgi:hypothetical protein